MPVMVVSEVQHTQKLLVSRLAHTEAVDISEID